MQPTRTEPYRTEPYRTMQWKSAIRGQLSSMSCCMYKWRAFWRLFSCTAFYVQMRLSKAARLKLGPLSIWTFVLTSCEDIFSTVFFIIWNTSGIFKMFFMEMSKSSNFKLVWCLKTHFIKQYVWKCLWFKFHRKWRGSLMLNLFWLTVSNYGS